MILDEIAEPLPNMQKITNRKALPRSHMIDSSDQSTLQEKMVPLSENVL
jgi:hypothetical protein